jgi:hypothetical protein
MKKALYAEEAVYCRTLSDETVEALWLKLDALKLVP